ncbi:YceI family protein [Nocardia brasiliensis]
MSTNSVDTGNSHRDAQLTAILNAPRFPMMLFTSENFRPSEEQCEVCGHLALNGVRRRARFSVLFSDTSPGSIAEFVACGTIGKSAFDLRAAVPFPYADITTTDRINLLVDLKTSMPDNC